MALSVTSIGDLSQAPGIDAVSYIPDQLIAGDLKIVTDTVTITGGAALKRGAVLGKVTASGSFKLSASASADGSQVPFAILAADADATGADVTAPIYLMGEFNSNALTFGAGVTATSSKDALRDCGIFLKSAVSASDPS